MSYSVVIVEDEPPARAKLERFIGELEDFRLAGHADTVRGLTRTTASASMAIRRWSQRVISIF